MFCHKHECVCCFQTVSSTDGGDTQHLENNASASPRCPRARLGLQAEGSGDFNQQTHPHMAKLLLFETFLRSTEQTEEKWFVFTFVRHKSLFLLRSSAFLVYMN